MQTRIKRLLPMIMSLSLLLGLALPLPLNSASAQSDARQGEQMWTVEYYNNVDLLGAAAYTSQVSDVGFGWTATAPVPDVNPNFFSARWTSIRNLDGGIYEVSVQADDGVRVLVNNAPLIQEFHTASGQTYSDTFEVPAGEHVIQVEYYEGGGVAYLDFDLERLNSAPDQPLAIVTAGRLNVRDAPSVVTGDVVTQVTQGESHTVLGRTADSQWWRITANGVTGWVSASWVNILNGDDVPVVDDEAPIETGFTLSATGNLNIRSGPGVEYPVVGWFPYLGTAQIIGRNAATTWWQIQYEGVTGWVSGVYSQLEFGVNIDDIPVTEGTVPESRLTAVANLNIRTGPGVQNSVIGWLPYLATAEIVGRNTQGTWWQIRYRGLTGWVSAYYTNPEDGLDLNAIPVTG